MYARVVIGQYHQCTLLDEAIQILRKSVLPDTRQQAGFQRIIVLADRSTYKAIAIGLRETLADIQATGSNGHLREQFAKVMRLLAGTPKGEIYEVSIQETQQATTGTYARVLTASLQPGKMNEGTQIVRDSILPAAKQQLGFTGGFWLLDRSTGKFMAITYWATRADLVANENSGYYQEQIAKVAAVLATQVVREIYEVAVQM